MARRLEAVRHPDEDMFTIYLVALMAFLCVVVWNCDKATAKANKEAGWRADEKVFQAEALDTSAIAPQVKRMRKDYEASARRRRATVRLRTRMLALARVHVTSLGYFGRVRRGDEPPKHVA